MSDGAGFGTCTGCDNDVKLDGHLVSVNEGYFCKPSCHQLWASQTIQDLTKQLLWHKWPDEANTYEFDESKHYLCLGNDDDEIWLLPDPALCVEYEWMGVSYFRIWSDDPRGAALKGESQIKEAGL